MTGLLVAASFALPLVLAAAALWPTMRDRLLGLLPLAPLAALAAAIFAPGGSLVLTPDPLRLTLALDTPGAMLLGSSALLWCAAGSYAANYLAVSSRRTAFAVWWLLTMAGSLGLCLVADMTSFYLFFTVASLAAYGLVAHEATPAAQRAGLVYMALALLGEAFLLLAFVVMAIGVPGGGNPSIAQAVAGIATSPLRDAILVLLVLGFGLKMGLVPLHVWMPLAHPVAPMPASAVLSGIVVKAGVVGLIRFLPFGAPLGGWCEALIVLGLFTAFYGLAIGLAQPRPKVVLAYSTVSQMGVVAAIAGAGLASGSEATPVLAAFYALHHMLVKGALFLGVGVTTAGGPPARPAFAVMAVLALALAGLPFTSGALAKYAVKDLFGEGIAALAVTLSATGSTLLMLHFLRRLSRLSAPDARTRPPPGLLLPFLATAAASFLVAGLLLPSTGTAYAAVFAPEALWTASWPMLLGAALAFALRRSALRIPDIPEGDLIVLAARLMPAVRRLVDAVEHTDETLRRWPVAGTLLLLLLLGLGAAMQLSAGFHPSGG
ncbi:formate hydrogenlyase subunit 3/multisubunit Na+/H+ antiporter MnhD subunit [Ancylobacter sp. 3268]|uniref:complex I subunit 5 family protein n=1 Tax=Ancylobacter sp. 3268 TaxID=2817752 RepID=UPI002859D7C3|nr:complex I subunit 5 family protein [Ancylobacter sp. 3268]MDR6951806.1 formate hydrogenlyase subunit 3/multisubunit Na+/H+ antiporter MnhD subunit [Ancylobacter sp. 3268]